jgi:regulator of cell morphogenesis and NO signaling
MSSVRVEQTIAQMVESDSRAASVFESVGLDYCCGGRRTLETACREAGIDPEAILRKLGQTPGVPSVADWSSLNPAELADHIEATHHAYLHEELPRLEELADRVVSRHAMRVPQVVTVQELVTVLRAELEPHLAKEEMVLFPMIRQLVASDVPTRFHCGTVANPIGVMVDDHDVTAALLRRLAAATDRFEPPPSACASFRALYTGLAELVADTHVHMHKENNVLFPAALALEEAVNAECHR